MSTTREARDLADVRVRAAERREGAARVVLVEEERKHVENAAAEERARRLARVAELQRDGIGRGAFLESIKVDIATIVESAARLAAAVTNIETKITDQDAAHIEACAIAERCDLAAPPEAPIGEAGRALARVLVALELRTILDGAPGLAEWITSPDVDVASWAAAKLGIVGQYERIGSKYPLVKPEEAIGLLVTQGTEKAIEELHWKRRGVQELLGVRSHTHPIERAAAARHVVPARAHWRAEERAELLGYIAEGDAAAEAPETAWRASRTADAKGSQMAAADGLLLPHGVMPSDAFDPYTSTPALAVRRRAFEADFFRAYKPAPAAPAAA